MKLKCPDCGNEDIKEFYIFCDFGEEIGEVKIGCKKCFDVFTLTYDEIDIDQLHLELGE